MADFYNNEFTFQNPKQKKYNELTQEQNQIDAQVNSNRESKYQDVIQEREQRAINQNKYGVDIPDEVYQVLNNGIANSDIPEETAYNIASAYKYSEMYGVPVEMAMENLESFNSLTFGSKQQATPKGNFEAICNSWQIGKNTLTMANLAADLREAEKNEDATLIANIEQQLALLESENNNLQDYQNRNFFIQSLKDGAQTLPYSGAVAIPGILNAFLPGLGTAAAGVTSAELASRLEYLNLRKSGATPEVARNVSSFSGIVQGATEMALGTVAKSLGTDKLGQVIGNKADDVVKAVLNKMHINSLGFSKVASAMVNYGLDATGEGIEEALQEFESFLGVVIAEKIQDEADGKIQAPEIQDMVNSAVQSFGAGFRSSLVLGGLANIPQGIASIQDAKAVKEAAQTIPSKEDFIKTTADSPIFEGMSDEKRKETQEEIYNSFEKQRSEILDTRAKDIDEVSDFQSGSEDNKIQEAEDTEEEVRGAAYRENGRLYTETDVTTDESGTVKGTFKIGNPTEETSYNRYGYINFTEGKDNTVTIENFKLTPGRQNLAVEMFEEFSEQFSDKNIIWKPKGKTGKALYKQLALNNPRGKNYGLSYFTENDTATIKDRHARLKLAKDIQSYFPNMSSAERATGVAIFESMAKSMGMGLDDYIQNTYRDGNVFADFSETGESATVIENGQKYFRKGAMTTFANDAKSIIYTTQHSDFSTFVHENAHVYRAHMTKELLEQAEKAFGVIDGDWNAKNYKTADGRTISYEEAFAEGFEDYLRTGQAKDSALKQIYDKIAQFMARIYNWMKNEARIDISPEIKNIYDQMVSGESSLAEAIAVTQKVDEQQREAYLAEQKQKQAQKKETEQKIFNDESTAEEIKDAKVEDVINSDTVAEDVKVEKILETVTDEQAEKELENINIDDIPIFQTITGEGLERLLRNNAKMQEALEKAKTFSNHGYSFDKFKTDDFVFRKIANKWAIETDDKKAYLGRKTVFDGIKKASNIKFSAMYQAALAKAQGNTEVAKEFVKSSNLIGTTLERNRFTLADVLGYEELYTAYPWMKTIPVKFVSVADKNLVNITENEIEINPFAGTFEELGPALLEKTQEILNKHQGISADTDIFNPKLDTALKSLIDKATLINREFRNYNDFIDASYEEVKDDLNYQIIGEIGAKALDDAEEATTRLDNLSIARQMEEQGKDALTIRLATGWEKGVDEQWRYEIDDVIKFSNKFYPTMYFLATDEEYKKLHNRVKENFLEYENFTEKEKKTYDFYSNQESKMIKSHITVDEAGNETWIEPSSLEDVIDAPILFSAYPQLKKVKFIIEDIKNFAGSYMKANNIITLSKNSTYEEKKSTLIHEIQHAIQRIEGFARGGNVEQFTDSRLENIIENIKEYRAILKSYDKQINLSEFSAQSLQEVVKKQKTIEKHFEDLENYRLNSNLAEMYKEINNRIKEAEKLYDEISGTPSNFERDLATFSARDKDFFVNFDKEKYIKEMIDLGFTEEDIKSMYSDNNGLGSVLDYIQRRINDGKIDVLLEEIQDANEKVIHEGEIKVKDKYFPTPYDAYLSLAGEVEARNVQNRMYMTSDERRKKLLQDTADVAALDQIILHQTDYASVMQDREVEENKQNENIRIKKGLSKTNDITNYLESKLKSLGFNVKRDASIISNSEYLTITNYKDMTGKESSYNESELKIRISNHDLPPSYDGLNGYHDYDIISENANRGGNDGNAIDYISLLQELNNEILPNIKQERKNNKKFLAQENNIAKKLLPEWTLSEDTIREKIKDENDLNTRFVLVQFANYKQNERAKRILEQVNRMKGDRNSVYYESFVKLGLIDNDTINFQSSPAEELKAIREQYENTDKWLKAPNGNDTNLTEKQWLQVRTPQFKEWFGDWENDPENASKVVDENGEPLVVYHGTEKGIFDIFKGDNQTVFDTPKNTIWFTENREIALSYSGEDKEPLYKNAYGEYIPAIYSTFLNIRNPYIYVNENEIYKPNSIVETVRDDKTYDGVILKAAFGDLGLYEEELDNPFIVRDDFVVFSPNQIKSATDNSGEFSAGNPSILFHTAYHGSPHNFDNFSTSAIGTGEGAQSFGWGLYFTNQEDIARWYADKLTNTEENEEYTREIEELEKEVQSLKVIVDVYKTKLKENNLSKRIKSNIETALPDFLKKIESKETSIKLLKETLNKQNKRNLYTVELPGNGYLLWDKIVNNDELEKIKKALKEKGINDLSRIENLQGYQEQYKNNENATYTIGSNIYKVIADYLGSDKAASLFLKDLGYIGIDYPADSLSGNTEEGKRNYVIFDEADINVIEHINYQDVSEEFLDSVNDATLKEAASFESWQDFMEYYETDYVPKNIDIPQDVTAGWYQRTWELAHNLKPSESINREEYLAEELAAGDTALVDDALFMTELSGSSNMLIPFLKAINYYKNTEEWQPQDAVDEQELERFRRIKNRVEYEIRHASILTNALRVAQGKPLTDKARRSLLSLIQANVRDYRALYADIMYEDRFAVNLADTNKGKVKIANPNMDVDTMSPEQLKEIADKIEFEELANKIKKGELLMDDEINRYINMLESQIKASDKKVKEAQKALEDEKLETSQDYKRISDWQQRQLLKYYDELLEAKGKLYEKDKRNLKKAEKGLKIAEPYQLDRNRRQSNYDTIFRQFQDMKKITEITGEVKEAMAHRDALYEAKLENTKLREAATALSETREIQKKLVKRAMRKIDFKTVDYEQAVKIIAIQETFEPLLLDGLNQWIDTDNPYLRTVYYDFKTDPEFAQKLEERSERKGGKNLRYLINLMKTKDIEEWTVDEKKKARQSLPRNDYIREFGIENLGRYRKGSLQLDLQSPEIQKMLKDTLSIDLYAAISGKPFVKWTITEMADLAELIGDLYAEGKSMLRAKQEAKKQEATRIRAKIEEAIRTGGIEIPDDAPEEEKEKYRKLLKKRESEILGYESTIQGTLQSDVKRKSLRNRLRHRGYSDATILRVARILDGNKEGENTKLLYYGADEAYNSKHRHIRERQQKIEKALIDNDIKVEELYKQITLGNFYKNGDSATFTVDELLFFAEADKDRPPEDKTNNFDGGTAYEAVVYGNMASPQEKEAIRQSLMDVTLSDDDLGLVQAQYKGMCEARFERIMQLVKTLDPKFLKFAEAIAYDYEKEFERMNKASIEEFNQPVWRVKKYIPLIRLGQTGEENENRVKEDLLGTSGIQNQNWVNKGMTQKRIKISPWNQRPVEIGLYKTWLDAVDRTEHFIAYSGYVRSLNRVYKSRDANGNRALMEAMYGKGMVTYIDDYINELANPTPTGQRTALDKICRTLRGKTAPAYLAWKMSGIIKQFCTSPWPYFQYLTPAEYISASYDFVKNYPELSASIKEKSVFMNSRVMDPVIDIIKEQQQKVTNKVGYGLNQFNAMGMKGLEMVDWMCVAPGWLATYRKEFAKLEEENANIEKSREKIYKDKLESLIAENEKVEVYMMKTMEELEEEAKQDLPKVLTQAELEQKAVSKADDITRRCQPSSRAEDLSPLFKNSGKNAELVKILLQFQTSLNVIWNNIRYDLPQAIKERNYHQIIGAIAGYAMAGIAMGLVTGGPYSDDDDDKETSLAKQILYYGTTQFTDSVPVLGSYITTLTQMLITGKGGMMYSNNTFPVLNEAMGTVQSAIKGDWDKAAINFGEGVGYFLGLPVSGTKELLESAGLRDDEKGAEFNPGAFLGWRE